MRLALEGETAILGFRERLIRKGIEIFEDRYHDGYHDYHFLGVVQGAPVNASKAANQSHPANDDAG